MQLLLKTCLKILCLSSSKINHGNKNIESFETLSKMDFVYFNVYTTKCSPYILYNLKRKPENNILSENNNKTNSRSYKYISSYLNPKLIQ